MRSRLALSLLVLVALLGSSCHGWSPHPPRPEPTVVRIGAPDMTNLQFLNFWVALGAGYFTDEGVEVDLQVPPMPGQTPQLLLQGQVDVAVLMPPMYLGVIAQEQPVKLFANLLTNDPINLVVARDVADSLDLSPEAPLRDRLEALAGLRIGVAPEPALRLRVLFESVGLDADEVVEIVVLHGEEQIPALAGGTIDALYTHTPFLEEALVDLDALLLVDQSAGEVPELADLQIHALVTTDEYIRDDPWALLAVTRAVYRAQQLIHDDPAAAADAVLASGVPGLDEERLAAIVEVYAPAVPATPRVPPDGVVRAADLFPARPSSPDFTQIDVDDYIAPLFAWLAVKLPFPRQ